MADRNTGIKVNVKPGDKSGLRDIENEGRRVGGSLKAAIGGALSEGVKGGQDAVKGLLSDVKGAMGTIAGLMGGLGLAEITKGALEANSKFGALSFGVRAAGGSVKDVTGIIKQLQITALETAQDSMAMVDVFEGMRGETGSIDFASDAIEDVATAARGAHKPLELMGAIAGTLNEKFGVEAGDDMKNALADVVGLSEKGGVGFDDMAQKLGLIGAYAKEAGLSGREGFGQMIGLLNMADNANGNFKKGLTAVGSLLEQLGSSDGKNKIGAALGLSGGALKGDAMSQLDAIMQKTKGQKGQLEKAFGGETLKLLVDMGKTYSTAFDETKGSVKQKGDAATAALRGALGDASKSAVTWADIQTEAAASMNEAPQKIATATEKLRQAFQSDKFQANLGKIIDKLPALAELIAKIVDFAVDNPAAAAGAVVGGTFAKGALETIIAGAFKSGAASAGTSMAAAIAGSAGPWSQVAALAGGPIGVAIAASIALALAAAMADAKDEQKRRDATAKEAQNMLKGVDKYGKGEAMRGMGGSYQIAGALEAATGIEFDPGTAISDATAGQATSGEKQRDEVMQERLLAKGKRGNADLAAGNALASKFGWGTPGEKMGVSFDGFAGGSSSATKPSGARGPEPTPSRQPEFDPSAIAQMMANGVASKTLNVKVTNASDIGGGGGPTGGVILPPGWKPR